MTDKKKTSEIDVKVHKRFLQFINDARSPMDLIVAPELPTKQLLRNIDAHERPLDDKRRDPIIGKKDAKQIIAARDQRSPLYGFFHIDDIRKIIDVNLDKWLVDWIVPWFGPATRGRWEDTGYDTPVRVAHAALVHTPDDHHNGRVLIIEQGFGNVSRTPLWKPEATSHTDAFEVDSPYPPGKSDALKDEVFIPKEGNLYCSGHSFLSDGKLLAVGGGGQRAHVAVPNMAWLFNPQIKEWELTRDKRVGPTFDDRQVMCFGRWYPTAISLGDDSGRVLIVNGWKDNSVFSKQMETYNEITGTFSKITGPVIADKNQSFWPYRADYPNLHLLRDGRVFFTRALRWGFADAPSVFSFTGYDTGQWAELADTGEIQSSLSGMSVLILGEGDEPDRILVVGAEKTRIGSDAVKVMDLPPTNSSSWESFTFPDRKKRERANAVLLPDGTVFICGGTDEKDDNCYLFDPTRINSNPLLPVDNMTVKRNATHNQALLLPSAQVVTMGTDDKRVSIFSPPYLFKSNGDSADQPHITSWPDPDANEFVYHGQNFNITTPHACSIGRVVMVRPMAVTHQMDTEQRVIPLLSIATDDHTLQVRAPNGRVSAYGSGHTHAIAPRGIYMLFILNNDGVPSKAKFVRLR